MFVCVCLSACPFISLSNCPFIHQSVCTLYFVPSKQKKVFFKYLSICAFVIASFWLFLYLIVFHLSICLLTRLSIYLYVCLSICLFVPCHGRQLIVVAPDEFFGSLRDEQLSGLSLHHRNRSLETQYSPESKHYKSQITSYNLQVTEIAVLKPNKVLKAKVKNNYWQHDAWLSKFN